jgi:predicted nucleic acid-binding protein
VEFLDANIFLRYLTRDDPAKAERSECRSKPLSVMIGTSTVSKILIGVSHEP